MASVDREKSLSQHKSSSPSQEKPAFQIWSGDLVIYNAYLWVYVRHIFLFTKLMRVLFSQLRRFGHMSVICIDYSVLLGQEKLKRQRNVDDTSTIVQKVECYVNWKKSRNTRVQDIVFLGFILSAKDITISLSSKKFFPIIGKGRVCQNFEKSYRTPGSMHHRHYNIDFARISIWTVSL